jgi:hypothetical protein
MWDDSGVGFGSSLSVNPSGNIFVLEEYSPLGMTIWYKSCEITHKLVDNTCMPCIWGLELAKRWQGSTCESCINRSQVDYEEPEEFGRIMATC